MTGENAVRTSLEAKTRFPRAALTLLPAASITFCAGEVLAASSAFLWKGVLTGVPEGSPVPNGKFFVTGAGPLAKSAANNCYISSTSSTSTTSDGSVDVATITTATCAVAGTIQAIYNCTGSPQ